MTLTKRIERLLRNVPSEMWTTNDNGELIPTLDLYLYIANELNIEYAVHTGTVGDLWRAVATLRHGDRTITADAISQHPRPNSEQQTTNDAQTEEELSTHVSQLQSRALLKAFRLYLYPHIKATQPESRKILLATVHILYRQIGYNRQQRLEHAQRLLGLAQPINSFNDLTNAELAELIVAHHLNDPSSQYD